MRPAGLAAAAGLALVLGGCAGGPVQVADLAGPQRLGGIAYDPPGGGGWRSVLYPPSAEGGLLHRHERATPAGTLMVQASLLRPYRPVAGEAEVVRWAEGAAGARRAWPAAPRDGAPCGGYAHRFDQTLPLGGPAAPWATVDERGVFCLDPSDPARMVQVRVFERTAPGGATGAAEVLALEVLPRVRAAAP